MAIKKRKIPGAALTERVGPEWKQALRDPMIQDFALHEKYDLNFGNVERAFLASNGFKIAPALDCSDQDHAFLHLLSSVLYYDFGKRLFSDPAYRRLDKYLFRIIGRSIHFGPVAREAYTTGLVHYRRERGHRHKRRWKSLSFINAVVLGKRPEEHWHEPQAKRVKAKS